MRVKCEDEKNDATDSTRRAQVLADVFSREGRVEIDPCLNDVYTVRHSRASILIILFNVLIFRSPRKWFRRTPARFYLR